MTLSIKNGGYAFLIRLDLMFSMSLLKVVPVITDFKRPIYQTFNSTNLIWKWWRTLKFKRSPVWVDLWYVSNVRFWLLIPEMNTSRNAMICDGMVNLFFYHKFNDTMPII